MTQTRQERKEQTRLAILATALAASREGGLAGLSLRSMARRVGIVPSAIYRHFSSIEELGLVLVHECFGALRETLRELRHENRSLDQMINNSAAVLVRSVTERPEHFLFIAREQVAGPSLVREAISRQLELIELELAIDLGRLKALREWSPEDLRALANLAVTAMAGIIVNLVARTDPVREADVTAQAERQLRILIIGAANWRSGTEEA